MTYFERIEFLPLLILPQVLLHYYRCMTCVSPPGGRFQTSREDIYRGFSTIDVTARLLKDLSPACVATERPPTFPREKKDSYPSANNKSLLTG